LSVRIAPVAKPLDSETTPGLAEPNSPTFSGEMAQIYSWQGFGGVFLTNLGWNLQNMLAKYASGN